MTTQESNEFQEKLKERGYTRYNQRDSYGEISSFTCVKEYGRRYDKIKDQKEFDYQVIVHFYDFTPFKNRGQRVLQDVGIEYEFFSQKHLNPNLPLEDVRMKINDDNVTIEQIEEFMNKFYNNFIKTYKK